MFDEEREVVDAVAQGRQEEAHDGEAVEEVFAEAVVSDFVFEFSVGGGDDADVDGYGFWGADAADFALFEDAQEFWLQLEAELAQFVEEDGAALSEFE